MSGPDLAALPQSSSRALVPVKTAIPGTQTPLPHVHILWKLEIDEGETATSHYHVWTTECGRFQLMRMKSKDKDYPLYGAQKKTQQGWDIFEYDAKQGPGYPKWYKSLQEAAESVEKYHGVTSNKYSLISHAQNLGLSGRNTQPKEKAVGTWPPPRLKVGDKVIYELDNEEYTITEDYNNDFFLIKGGPGDSVDCVTTNQLKRVESKTPTPRTEARRTGPREATFKMNCLDAAAMVLEEEEHPMRPDELIPLMKSRGYWETSKGTTPEATLNASLCVDIKRKGERSRFYRVSKGLFYLNKKE